jgi:hypothetical protein
MNRPLRRGAFVCALTLATFALCVTPALAAAPACESTYQDAVTAGQQAAARHANSSFVDYAGVDAAALIREINAEEPRTDWTADHVLALDIGAPYILVAIIADGCVARTAPASPKEWRAILDRAFGAPL